MIPPAILSQDCFGYLCFHINFKIICSSFVKNATGILIGFALNLWIALDSMAVLTILLLPTQEKTVCSTSGAGTTGQPHTKE